MTGNTRGVKSAVVLAGGLGTRLRPLTLNRPKQMLPIVDRPMIEHVVGKLVSEGVEDVVLSLCYRPDEFLLNYPEGRCGGAGITYAAEPSRLGTAGGLLYAARRAEETGGCLSETFMVVNGDILTEASFDALLTLHRARNAEATILTIPVDDVSRFGSVLASPDGQVLSFVEKPSDSVPAGGWINAGIYVLEPSVLNRIADGRSVSMEREIFPMLAEAGSLYALGSEDYWMDAGTPMSYLHSQLDLISGRRSQVLEGVDPTAKVSPDASVSESVIMERAEVEEEAVVRRSVILPGGKVCRGARVTDAVVGFDAVVSERAVVDDLRLLADGEKV